MKALRRGPLVPLVLIVCTVVAGVLHQVGYLQGAEDFILRVVTPLHRWFSARTSSVGHAVQSLRDVRGLAEENERLRRENDALIIENVQLKEAEGENVRLRQLLDFARSEPSYEFRGAEVVARVIGEDPSLYLDYIIIDQGERQGISLGMPVATERGLVGRVTTVHDTTSEVLLITDVNSAVTALTQSSRATGIVRGVAGGGLVLNQVAQDAELNEGDIVLTSGLGGIFPKGLVIGQITGVHQRDFEMFQAAEVRPTVNFRDLEQVLVIASFAPLADVGPLPE
jgi:rod shape-determining protein MreC